MSLKRKSEFPGLSLRGAPRPFSFVVAVKQKGWSGSSPGVDIAGNGLPLMPMSNDHPWDDGVFAAPGTSMPPPRFVSSLITQLGLSRASPQERERGVAEWLRSNTPSKALRGSLIRCGYGHLLEQ